MCYHDTSDKNRIYHRKKYRRPIDRQAHLKSKHLVNKKFKEARTTYIEEILGIANSVDHSDSNGVVGCCDGVG